MSEIESKLYASVENTLQDTCVLYACITLIVYDFLTTIPTHEHLLRNRSSRLALLYTLNRLLIFAFAVTYCFTSNSILSCTFQIYAFMVVFSLITGLAAAVVALRTHAVSGGKLSLVIPTVLFGLVPIATNMYVTAASKITFTSHDVGCVQQIPYNNTTGTLLEIVSRVPLILSDLIVAGATWHRMLETRKSTGERRVFSAWFTGLSLCAVVLRDGTLYFLSISLCNILALVVFIENADSVYNLPMIITVLSSIFISHFLLHLGEVAAQRTDGPDSRPSSLASSGTCAGSTWLSSVGFFDDVVDDEGEPQVDALAGRIENDEGLQETPSRMTMCP